MLAICWQSVASSKCWQSVAVVAVAVSSKCWQSVAVVAVAVAVVALMLR